MENRVRVVLSKSFVEDITNLVKSGARKFEIVGDVQDLTDILVDNFVGFSVRDLELLLTGFIEHRFDEYDLDIEFHIVNTGIN